MIRTLRTLVRSDSERLLCTDSRPPGPPMARFRAIEMALLMGVVVVSGCGTIVSRSQYDSYYYDLHHPRVYGGTVFDAKSITAENVGLLFLLDLPLSLVADTVLLPLTAYEQWFQGDFQDAAVRGDTLEMRRLYSEGGDINGMDPYGHTPLMAASWAGQMESVGWLVQQRADLEAKSKVGGATALIYACVSARPDVVERLLDAGADPNEKMRDDSQATPLIVAAGVCHPEVLVLLLRAGADLDASSRYGSTPARAAANGQCLENLRLLIAEGASLEGTLNIADFHKNEEMSRILIEAGATR